MSIGVCVYKVTRQDEVLHDMNFLARSIKEHKHVQLNHFNSQYSLSKIAELRCSEEKRRVCKNNPGLENMGVGEGKNPTQNKPPKLWTSKTRFSCSSSLSSWTTKTTTLRLKLTTSETHFQTTWVLASSWVTLPTCLPGVWKCSTDTSLAGFWQDYTWRIGVAETPNASSGLFSSHLSLSLYHMCLNKLRWSRAYFSSFCISKHDLLLKQELFNHGRKDLCKS